MFIVASQNDFAPLGAKCTSEGILGDVDPKHIAHLRRAGIVSDRKP